MLLGLIMLESLAFWGLRVRGYWPHGIACPRCGRIHAPPRSYRGAHQPREDWVSLERQCSRLHSGGR